MTGIKKTEGEGENSELAENGIVVNEAMIEELYEVMSVIDDRRTPSTQILVKNIISVFTRHASV